MNWNRLQGEQYIRLGPGVAEKIAPYLGVAPEIIEELVLDVPIWPEEIRPLPVRGWDGRLIAGDPLLLDADQQGLYLAAHPADISGVLVSWNEIISVQVLQRTKQA